MDTDWCNSVQLYVLPPAPHGTRSEPQSRSLSSVPCIFVGLQLFPKAPLYASIFCRKVFGLAQRQLSSIADSISKQYKGKY